MRHVGCGGALLWGTKLGVGGLVNAYRSAAADALSNNKIVQKMYQAALAVRFAYSATSEVQRLIHHYGAKVTEQSFDQNCFYRLLVPRSNATRNNQGIKTYRRRSFGINIPATRRVACVDEQRTYGFLDGPVEVLNHGQL